MYAGRARLEHLHAAAITGIYIVAAVVLGLISPKMYPSLVSPIQEDALIAILSAISSGMIALTGLVFSLVFVIVQFGSATYSPRITALFSRSKVLFHSMGIFTGTFLFSLMALRATGIAQSVQVSGFTVWLAFAWLLASVVALARLVRVFSTLTVSHILSDLERMGSECIKSGEPFRSQDSIDDNEFFDAILSEHDLCDFEALQYKGPTAYYIGCDGLRLLGLAVEHQLRIYIPNTIGTPVSTGKCIVKVEGRLNHSLAEEIRGSLKFGTERAFRDDPKYALRLLGDIAVRGLCEMIDPTTAVQALDHIESLLYQLGASKLRTAPLHDTGATPRVFFAYTTWEEYLQLSLLEIMQVGAISVQIQRRLVSVFHSLRESLPEQRRPALDMLARERKGLAENALRSSFLQAVSELPDPQGLGGR